MVYIFENLNELQNSVERLTQENYSAQANLKLDTTIENALRNGINVSNIKNSDIKNTEYGYDAFGFLLINHDYYNHDNLVDKSSKDDITKGKLWCNLLEKCNAIKKKKGLDKCVFVIATHHNRMKDSYFSANYETKKIERRTFRGMKKEPMKPGFANNFTVKLKIKVTGEGINIFPSVVFAGYRDKLSKYDYYGFGSNDNIKRDIFGRILDYVGDAKCLRELGTTTIYMVRHGDAMHNTVFDLGHMNRDSTLTPFGMVQAMTTSQFIMSDIVNDRDFGPEFDWSSIIPVGSFLTRAQHTASLITYGLNSKPSNLLKLYNIYSLLRINQHSKFAKYGDYQSFEPLKYIFRDLKKLFETNCKDSSLFKTYICENIDEHKIRPKLIKVIDKFISYVNTFTKEKKISDVDFDMKFSPEPVELLKNKEYGAFSTSGTSRDKTLLNTNNYIDYKTPEKLREDDHTKEEETSEDDHAKEEEISEDDHAKEEEISEDDHAKEKEARRKKEMREKAIEEARREKEAIEEEARRFEMQEKARQEKARRKKEAIEEARRENKRLEQDILGNMRVRGMGPSVQQRVVDVEDRLKTRRPFGHPAAAGSTTRRKRNKRTQRKTTNKRKRRLSKKQNTKTKSKSGSKGGSRKRKTKRRR
jgi:broad specificity phosphatase PhoE